MDHPFSSSIKHSPIFSMDSSGDLFVDIDALKRKREMEHRFIMKHFFPNRFLQMETEKRIRRYFKRDRAFHNKSLEQATAAHRKRLKSLKKQAQQLLQNPNDDDDQLLHSNGVTIQQDNANVEFRNYLPHDKHLQEGKLAPPVLRKFEDPVVVEPPKEEKKEDPFLNIASQKPNWDLRRDVQKKLDKHTQKATFQLMEEEEKQKLGEEGKGEDNSEQ